MQGKSMYALGAGSLSSAWRVRPNDLIHWKVMEWGCQNGYLKYHMGGVAEPPPNEGSSKWGIWRWKKEWKGQLEGEDKFGKLVLPQYILVLKAMNLLLKTR